MSNTVLFVFQSIGFSGPTHHHSESNVDLVNPDEFYKSFANISLQTIYLGKGFQLFPAKPLSDVEVFKFKSWPNDLAGYGLNTWKKWTELLMSDLNFGVKLAFLQKKKQHLN